ncbi:MAG: DNA-protecting protein DprA [bacterium]|nr:DNA-protecting protein DprA [bacterium]
MKDARLQVACGGLHPDRVRKLYADYGPQGTLRRLEAGAVKTSDRVRRAVAVSAAERRSELGAAGIAIVYRGDPGYPDLLTQLEDAPDLLFVRGDLPSGPCVAVVGTRRCTSYGRRIAELYGRAIAAAGWPVISGLARGVDGAAHLGTVAVGGTGVAILGSGVDVMYPREHAPLALDLIDNGGAVVSEAPPGSPPEGWRFPPRNRIISGMAGAVIVVEATVKGGALITAEAALRHGRQVFAVPGDIGRSSSEGCNLLIRDGAFPVLGPDDLLESLELVLGASPRASGKEQERALEEADRRMVDLIASGVNEIDELLAGVTTNAGEALSRLGKLEMAGVILTDGSGRYSLA